MSTTLIVPELEQLEPARRVVTIGTFDGVHRGHHHLLALTVDRARALGARSTAITFEPIPASVLRPESYLGRICPADDKLTQIASSGIDEIVTLRFDRDFAQQTPEAFMTRLAATGELLEVWVGESFALGRNRAGNVRRLGEIGTELGFTVHAVPRLHLDGENISSSAIREAIWAGDVTRAWTFLGRPFRVTGEVIHGAHLGRTIGFPTANVVPPANLVSLADGIYASYTTLPGTDMPHPSMTYVGTRPTVNSGDRLVETNLLDFEGDLYGQVLSVDVLARLRGDQVFDGLDPMIAQLHRDEVAAREFLAAHPPGSLLIA